MPAGWAISPDVGRLVQVLCRAAGVRRLIEFGTLAGYSALWFARALPADGRVISIEIDPGYAAFAREQLAKTDAGAKVEVRVGAALEMLPVLEAEVRTHGTPFDAVFLDADKAHYPEFLDWSTRVLRRGACCSPTTCCAPAVGANRRSSIPPPMIPASWRSANSTGGWPPILASPRSSSRWATASPPPSSIRDGHLRSVMS